MYLQNHLTEPSATHYNRAPITEAVIDLRVRPSANVPLDALMALHTANATAYPTFEPLHTGAGFMQFGAVPFANVQSAQIGFLSRSADERQLYQARLDGFSLSRLAPYGHWETFRDEAWRLWAQYRSIIGQTVIERVAVRYINRLDIPIPVPDLAHYLRTLPTIAPELPQTMAGYFMHLQLPIPDIQAMAIINQTVLTPPPTPGHISIIIDIDLFRAEAVPDDEGIWSLLETFRHVKNNIFEACITDQTRRLFQ